MSIRVSATSSDEGSILARNQKCDYYLLALSRRRGAGFGFGGHAQAFWYPSLPMILEREQEALRGVEWLFTGLQVKGIKSGWMHGRWKDDFILGFCIQSRCVPRGR